MTFQRGTHHKLLTVELGVFVARDGDGDGLLVGVVVAGEGRSVVAGVQAVGLLRRDGQHGQHQLLLASPDQIHHLLVCGSLDVYPVAVERRQAYINEGDC